MLEKVITSTFTLIAARQLWHSDTKTKYENELRS